MSRMKSGCVSTEMLTLGALRLQPRNAPELYLVLCGRKKARYGSVSGSIKELKVRVLFLPRQCLASLAPLGYVHDVAF